MAEDWALRGACAFQPSELFFPDHSEHPAYLEPAKQVCKGCEVRQQCLDYSIRLNIEYGVWGGLSPKERKRVRRKRRAA